MESIHTIHRNVQNIILDVGNLAGSNRAWAACRRASAAATRAYEAGDADGVKRALLTLDG